MSNKDLDQSLLYVEGSNVYIYNDIGTGECNDIPGSNYYCIFHPCSEKPIGKICPARNHRTDKNGRWLAL